MFGTKCGVVTHLDRILNVKDEYSHSVRGNLKSSTSRTSTDVWFFIDNDQYVIRKGISNPLRIDDKVKLLYMKFPLFNHKEVLVFNNLTTNANNFFLKIFKLFAIMILNAFCALGFLLLAIFFSDVGALAFYGKLFFVPTFLVFIFSIPIIFKMLKYKKYILSKEEI